MSVFLLQHVPPHGFLEGRSRVTAATALSLSIAWCPTGSNEPRVYRSVAEAGAKSRLLTLHYSQCNRGCTEEGGPSHVGHHRCSGVFQAAIVVCDMVYMSGLAHINNPTLRRVDTRGLTPRSMHASRRIRRSSSLQ